MVQTNIVKSPITVRIKFKKVGELQYISHLDLVRTMSKVVVRASLPLWYTEGYNPKPKLTFGPPLSIGVESECEYLDLRLSEYCDPSVIKNSLNRNLTENMQVSEVYYPTCKLSALSYLSYELRILTPSASEELRESIEATLTAPTLEVMKRTKAGDVLTDIRASVREVSVLYEGGAILIRATLTADSASFLNPEYLISAIRQKHGILLGDRLFDEAYSIRRLCAYAADMTPFV